MNILVCITHVPDTTSKISFVNDNTEFDKSGVQYIIGPYDDYALARAVELKSEAGASVTVLNVGGAESEQSLRKALAIGADNAVRIDAEPSDSFFVASQIAHFTRDKGFDLILMGRESIDYNGGVVPGMVGELLSWPSISPVMALSVSNQVVQLTREIEGGKEVLEVVLPLVAGCQEPIAEWKIPNMRGIMMAKSKPLEVIQPVEAHQYSENMDYELPKSKQAVKIVESGNEAELVDLLKNEARVL